MAKLPKRLERTEHVVLVCEGSDCKKNGAKAVRKALKSHIKARGVRKSVLLLKTKCTDHCKRGPICGFQPANEWLAGATPSSACEKLDAILDE